MKELPKKILPIHDDCGTIHAGPIELFDKINQIIDYLQEREEHIPDVSKMIEEKQTDWIDKAILRLKCLPPSNNVKWGISEKGALEFREAIEKHMPQQLKPIQNIDLITERLMNKLFWIKEDTERKIIKSVLSQYGVQEKKFTKEYVWNSMKELPCITAFMINQTYKFLEKEGMLSE